MNEIFNMTKEEYILYLKFRLFLRFLKRLVRKKEREKMKELRDLNLINVDEFKDPTEKLQYLKKKLEEINNVIEKYKNFNNYSLTLKELLYSPISKQFKVFCARGEFKKILERTFKEGILIKKRRGITFSNSFIEEVKKERLRKLEKKKKIIEENIKIFSKSLENEQGLGGL